MSAWRVRSYARPGRLTPAQNRGLRARAVQLKAGAIMPWHSTAAREELLLVLQGRALVEVVEPRQRLRPLRLAAEQSLWLPARTIHRVVNTARRALHYVYVTGPSFRAGR